MEYESGSSRNKKRLSEPTLNHHKEIEENGKDISNCQRNLRCYFYEFCDNTSVHGFKFLGERKRYLIERIWWFLVVTFALSCSGVLIYKAHAAWIKAPVIVTFGTTETPIWQIPFPAVTVCPESKINKKLLNYSDVLSRIFHSENVTEKELKYFLFLKMVCDDISEELDGYFNLNITEESIHTSELQTYLDALTSLDYEECKWMGTRYNCDDLFTTMYTSDGKCQTFNILDPYDLYTEPE